MSNLRIIYKNLIHSTDVLSADSTSGSLVASNLLTENKFEVHRSIGTTVLYTLEWPSNVTISSVILPCTNLSSTATVRIRGYNLSDVLVYDSTDISAIRGYNIDLNNQTHTVNLFSQGFTSKASVWIDPEITVPKCTIEIKDPSNSAGFIDNSKIVIGEYWEPTFNFTNGISLEIADSSRNTRTDSGNLVSDVGIIYEKIGFKYSLLNDTDKDNLNKFFRLTASGRNFLLSLFPEDTINEFTYTIYGRREQASLNHRLFGYYDSSVEVTSW